MSYAQGIERSYPVRISLIAVGFHSDMCQNVHRYEREGAWSSSHGFYYRCAWFEYEEYRRHVAALLEEEAALRESHKSESPEMLSSLVRHETDALWNRCYRSAVSSHLFGCIAFEGFLNFYGVKRLGEEFYKRQIERLGITEKVPVLILSCRGLLLEADSAILTNVRHLFDARNKLVHPKAREIDLSRIHDYVVEHPSRLPTEGNMALIESVITDFCAFDPDICRDFEFQKPESASSSDLQGAARPSAG